MSNSFEYFKWIGWKLLSDKKDHMVKYYSKKLTIYSKVFDIWKTFSYKKYYKALKKNNKIRQKKKLFFHEFILFNYLYNNFYIKNIY